MPASHHLFHTHIIVPKFYAMNAKIFRQFNYIYKYIEEKKQIKNKEKK